MTSTPPLPYPAKPDKRHHSTRISAIAGLKKNSCERINDESWGNQQSDPDDRIYYTNWNLEGSNIVNDWKIGSIHNRDKESQVQSVSEMRSIELIFRKLNI